MNKRNKRCYKATSIMNKSLALFLIKAAGLSSDEILKKLQERLQHDLAIEKVIVHQQLSAIALLRLSQEIQA